MNTKTRPIHQLLYNAYTYLQYLYFDSVGRQTHKSENEGQDNQLNPHFPKLPALSHQMLQGQSSSHITACSDDIQVFHFHSRYRIFSDGMKQNMKFWSHFDLQFS